MYEDITEHFRLANQFILKTKTLLMDVKRKTTVLLKMALTFHGSNRAFLTKRFFHFLEKK